jgi:hypothetical protein
LAGEVNNLVPIRSCWIAFGQPTDARRRGSGSRHRNRKTLQEFTRELSVELAIGSVDAIIQRLGEALAAPQTRLQQEIKSASVVNIDETGWKDRRAAAA